MYANVPPRLSEFFNKIFKKKLVLRYFVCEILSCIYGCYLIIKLTSMCDTSICTYKTYQHDAKYLFELYSMTLQTFSYVVPASCNLLSKG